MIKYFVIRVTSLFVWSNKVNDSVKLPKDVAAEYQKLPKELDYNQHVKPILSDKCFACHGPDKAKQKTIISTDPTYLMPTPKSHLTLSAKEKAVLVKWIENEAVDY